MTPERINDDDLLNGLETSLLETIETATAELEAVRTVQRLARAGRSGRPRGSKNKPREGVGGDIGSAGSVTLRNYAPPGETWSELDELKRAEPDAAP